VKLPPARGVEEFQELRFKPEAARLRGVPPQGCWVRRGALERLISRGGAITSIDLILGLMDWLDVTSDPKDALHNLQMLLDRHYPAQGATTARCQFVDEHGQERVCHVGAIDCTQPLVTWQRSDWIIAAAQPSEERGRFRVGAFGPISLKVARSILAHSLTREMGQPIDSFAALKRSSRSAPDYYAWERGAVSLVARDQPCSPAGGWLAPNQLISLLAIAGGFPLPGSPEPPKPNSTDNTA
jgi:hypothetical protein